MERASLLGAICRGSPVSISASFVAELTMKHTRHASEDKAADPKATVAESSVLHGCSHLALEIVDALEKSGGDGIYKGQRSGSLVCHRLLNVHTWGGLSNLAPSGIALSSSSKGCCGSVGHRRRIRNGAISSNLIPLTLISPFDGIASHGKEPYGQRRAFSEQPCLEEGD